MPINKGDELHIELRRRVNEESPGSSLGVLARPASGVLYEAAHLISEDGENPEYDRALCELIACIIPSELEICTMAKLVGRTLGVKSEMYNTGTAEVFCPGALVKWVNPDDDQEFEQGRIIRHPTPMRTDLPQNDLGVIIHHNWRRITACTVISPG